jgi:hypothetical protein
VARLTAALGRTWSGEARSWSLAALFAGVVGGGLDAALIIGTQEDKSSLLWPVILLPVLVVPMPVFVPQRAVRVGAAVVMAVWCWLATFSLGPMLVPCLLLMIGAALREDA